MRIESRVDGEWLVDVVGDFSDCDKELACSRHCDGYHIAGGEYDADGAIKIICHHLNGEHLAVSHPRRDGASEILARWPIDPATATTAPRILTPAEARAAQAPYVAKEIERINEGLAMGMRSFAVNAPLFEDVKRALTTAGWVALNDGEAHGRVSFAVRERAEGERCKSAR
jgi:hypothetical protein